MVYVQDAPGGELEILEPQYSDDLWRKMVGLGEGVTDHLLGRDALGRGHLIGGREDLSGQWGSFSCQGTWPVAT